MNENKSWVNPQYPHRKNPNTKKKTASTFEFYLQDTKFTAESNRRNLKYAFKYIFNPNNTEGSLFSHFMGFRRPEDSRFYKVTYALGGSIFVVAKNTLKLIAEYLPALVELYSAWAMSRLFKYFPDKQKFPNPFVRFPLQILTGLTIGLLGIPRYVAKAVRIINRLVTSPKTSMNVARQLGGKPLAAISIISSVLLYAALAVVVVAVLPIVLGAGAVTFGFASTFSLGALTLNTATTIGSSLLGALSFGVGMIVNAFTNPAKEKNDASRMASKDTIDNSKAPIIYKVSDESDEAPKPEQKKENEISVKKEESPHDESTRSIMKRIKSRKIESLKDKSDFILYPLYYATIVDDDVNYFAQHMDKKTIHVDQNIQTLDKIPNLNLKLGDFILDQNSQFQRIANKGKEIFYDNKVPCRLIDLRNVSKGEVTIYSFKNHQERLDFIMNRPGEQSDSQEDKRKRLKLRVAFFNSLSRNSKSMTLINNKEEVEQNKPGS